MRHDELLEICQYQWHETNGSLAARIMSAVVELHKPEYGDFPDEDAICLLCSAEREYVIMYPCQTILAIEKELA